MTTLVVGASGATGRLLIQQLLAKNEAVKIIVRSVASLYTVLPIEIIEHQNLTITEADLLTLTEDELVAQVRGCRAVISCLGHNLTLKGMFGHPRRLVTESVRRLCHAIHVCSASKISVKFILMNSTGNRNVLVDDKLTFLQAITISLIRICIPPHADNEDAANYLQNQLVNLNSQIEWVVVRPDSLTNEVSVTHYEIYPRPICSALFGDGKTSRINVAHFMTQLVIDKNLWNKWKSQMPVIYNKVI